MSRLLPLAFLTVAACGDDVDPPPAPSLCTQTQQLTDALPEFCLWDANPTSPTGDQAVSPRDYLEAISGWYFASAT